MTTAEHNENEVYRILSANSETSFEKPSLYTFEVYADSQDKLDKVLNTLQDRCMIDARTVFCNNIYAAEVTIPKTIIV